MLPILLQPLLFVLPVTDEDRVAFVTGTSEDGTFSATIHLTAGDVRNAELMDALQSEGHIVGIPFVAAEGLEFGARCRPYLPGEPELSPEDLFGKASEAISDAPAPPVTGADKPKPKSKAKDKPSGASK